MKIDIKDILSNLKLFFEGAIDLKSRSTSHIEAEVAETVDQFILLSFADLLGLELPTNYYALELLPYLAEDMDSWKLRMLDKKSVWEERGATLNVDP